MKPHPFHKTVFLVGAGISIDAPSSIPPAHPILKIFAQWLADGNSELEARLLERCTSGSTDNPFDFIRFEALIQQVAFFAPEILRMLAAIEKSGTPNAHHLFLVDALNKGATIITTNFDTRFEEAAEWLDIDSRLFTLSSRHKTPPPDARLIKIHGTFPHKQSNHCLPRATLNQIGTIGLSFDRFPVFRRWFESITEGATLYVMGYSASDSFDVVPLLEEHCRADRVEWFEYRPGITGLSHKVIKHGNPYLLPEKRTGDFPYMTLERIKAAGVAHVGRVSGSSLHGYLALRFGGMYRRNQRMLELASADIDVSGFSRENLDALRQGLQSLELEPHHKALICGELLEEGTFGQSYTEDGRDEEYPPIDSPLYSEVRELVESNDLDGARQRLELVPESERDQNFQYAHALVSLKQDDIKGGFATLREIMKDTAEDDPQLNMMQADAEFNEFLNKGDVREMRRVRAWTREQARKSGILWGLVLWDSMTARECEWRLKKGDVSTTVWRRVSEQGLHYSFRFAYYSLRTGRREWFFPAVRLYTYFLTTAHRYQEAEEVLKCLLVWVGDANAEDRGVTLTNMITLCLYRNDLKGAARYLRQMRNVPDTWALKPLFCAISAADIARIRGRRKVALKQLVSAEELLRTLSPDDTWDHALYIERLKTALERQTGSKAGFELIIPV